MQQETESKAAVHAYTPGLKVKRSTEVEKLRRLPVAGEVCVKLEENVSFDTVIARTQIPGDPQMLAASDILGCDPYQLPEMMKKKEGDTIKKGEVIGGFSIFFGLMKKSLECPCDGYIESISDVTGNVIIREPNIPIEVLAYIPGKVAKVLPGEGAVIKTNAAFIQGIFGIGRETHGTIQVLVKSPQDALSADMINEGHKGKIIIGGSIVTREALDKAVKVGVAGIVTGGIRDADIIDFLGYEIGVAITGHEEVGITLIITEGFGETNMPNRTFNLLKSFEGHYASINGATQIRAGVLRPEIIIPHSGEPEKGDIEDELAGGMIPGTLLRIIRNPHFGKIGRVKSLPVELQRIETESQVRVVEVTLENDSTVIVPRANVEIIEE